jgi:YHS domain-containing protein
MKTLQIVLTDFLVVVIYAAETIARKMTNASAMKGYDPVAYFLEKKASKGKNEFRYEWSGSKWLFSSQANLDAFKADPKKYTPQYGGLCAFGISVNRKVYANPDVWTIFDDKLYFNYNLKVRELWFQDISARIQKGNEFWSLLNQ